MNRTRQLQAAPIPLPRLRNIAHRKSLLAITCALLLCSWATAAAALQSVPPVFLPAGVSHSGYVGAGVCASCHSQVAQAFASNPHAGRGDAGSCEACHGPGRPHVESHGDPAKIFNPGVAPAQEINQRCLSCHAGRLAAFRVTAHGQAGLNCVTCHKIHGSLSGRHLLKTAEPTLCFQCHLYVASDFSLPFHHPVPESRMVCSDCHNPHGNVPREARTAADVNAACARCHQKEAGPFRYEHAAVQIEGCLGCHSPHGSGNFHLLNQSDVNAICQECHNVSGSTPHSRSVSSTGHADGRTRQKNCCTDCHASFHGSNLDRTFVR